MKESKAFFALPLESKLSYSRGVEKIQGYSSFGREVLEDEGIIEAKESFDVHCLDVGAVDSEELKREARGAIQSTFFWLRIRPRTLPKSLLEF